MTSLRRSKAFIVSALVALVVAGPVVAGCSSGSTTATASAAAEATAPNLVGSWEGDYSYPTATGELVSSPLLIVIEKQEDRALWGYEQFTNDGETEAFSLTGSIGADGSSLGFASAGFSVVGEMVDGGQMRLRFFVPGDTPTSFEVTLTQASTTVPTTTP